MSDGSIRKDSKEYRPADRTKISRVRTLAKDDSQNWPLGNDAWLTVALALVLLGIVSSIACSRGRNAEQKQENASAETGDKAKSASADEHGDKAGSEVELEPEALVAAGIETIPVTKRAAIALVRVTGTVEANQQQMQQVTPLVSGRVESVRAALGDRVRKGVALAVISSPQVAEKHGKLHEAETRLALAEATLRRTRRLIELGAGAGKDLTAAESDVETARAEISHLKQELRALDATVPDDPDSDPQHDVSIIELKAPISGTVTERLVNPGAGIEAGKPLFTIANLARVWVIANVPGAQVGLLRLGTPAEVRSPALAPKAIAGRVTYIDPLLNEETRTARVRIEVANPGGRLQIGTFVEVGFQAAAAGTGGRADEELVIPDEAVQRVSDSTVVFVAKEGEAGHFEVRNVEVGGTIEGYRRVLSGLALGERVVTKGSFTLKTRLLKGEMGEHGH